MSLSRGEMGKRCLSFGASHELKRLVVVVQAYFPHDNLSCKLGRVGLYCVTVLCSFLHAGW